MFKAIQETEWLFSFTNFLICLLFIINVKLWLLGKKHMV